MTHPFARFFKSSKTHRKTSLPLGSFLVPRLEFLEGRINPSFANMDIIAQSLREAEDALPQIPGLDSNLAQMVPYRLSDALALNNIGNGNTSWSQFDTTYPNPTASDLQTIAQTISQVSTTGGPTVSGFGTQISAGSAMTSSVSVPVWGVLPDLMLGQYAGFTVQAWINSTTLGNYSQRIIDLGNGASSNNIIVGVNGAKLWLATYNGGSAVISYVAGPTLAINTWNHVSAVFNGTTASLYLNGALVGTETSMPQIQNVARSANYWGQSNWSTDIVLQGQQDELRIWNRALTAPEIALNYNLSLPSGTPGLLLYYKADESSGQTLTDSSGNNNGGTLETSYNNILPDSFFQNNLWTGYSALINPSLPPYSPNPTNLYPTTSQGLGQTPSGFNSVYLIQTQNLMNTTVYFSQTFNNPQAGTYTVSFSLYQNYSISNYVTISIGGSSFNITSPALGGWYSFSGNLSIPAGTVTIQVQPFGLSGDAFGGNYFIGWFDGIIISLPGAAPNVFTSIPGGGRFASTVALSTPTVPTLTWTQKGTYLAGFSTGGLDAGLHLNRTGDSTLPIEYTSTLTMTMIVDAANHLKVGVSANWNATANLSGEAISAGLGFLDSSIVGASYSLSASASSVLFDTITQAAAPAMVAAMTAPLSDFTLVRSHTTILG